MEKFNAMKDVPDVHLVIFIYLMNVIQAFHHGKRKNGFNAHEKPNYYIILLTLTLKSYLNNCYECNYTNIYLILEDINSIKKHLNLSNDLQMHIFMFQKKMNIVKAL